MAIISNFPSNKNKQIMEALSTKQPLLTGSQGQVVGFDQDGNAVPQAAPDTAVAATKLAAARTIDGVSFDGSAAITHYGTCSTAASTAAKVVTLTGFTLVAGAVVVVKFTNGNTASNPTLNVNGTGAKYVKKYGTTAADAYMWQAGEVAGFVYDGTNWIMVKGGLATTTYYGLTKLSSSVTSTSASLAATPSAVKQAYDLAKSKQDKLTGTPGQVVGFDATGVAAAQSGWSNLNLLDNAYWASKDSIINQRGQTEYTGPGITIDRFGSTGLTTTLEDGWIKLQNETDQLQYFSQNAETSQFPAGRNVTLSLLYKSNTPDCLLYCGYAEVGQPFVGCASVILSNSETPQLAYASSNVLPNIRLIQWQTFSIGIPAGGTVYVKAAKLELGSQQTLAHQDADGNWVLNDPPPNPALELAKCQKYFRAYNGGRIRVYNPFSWSRPAYDLIGIVFDQPMRVTPTGEIVCSINDGEYQTVELYAPMCGNQKIASDIAVPSEGKLDIVSYAVSADL